MHSDDIWSQDLSPELDLATVKMLYCTDCNKNGNDVILTRNAGRWVIFLLITLYLANNIDLYISSSPNHTLISKSHGTPNLQILKSKRNAGKTNFKFGVPWNVEISVRLGEDEIYHHTCITDDLVEKTRRTNPGWTKNTRPNWHSRWRNFIGHWASLQSQVNYPGPILVPESGRRIVKTSWQYLLCFWRLISGLKPPSISTSITRRRVSLTRERGY